MRFREAPFFQAYMVLARELVGRMEWEQPVVPPAELPGGERFAGIVDELGDGGFGDFEFFLAGCDTSAEFLSRVREEWASRPGSARFVALAEELAQYISDYGAAALAAAAREVADFGRVAAGLNELAAGSHDEVFAFIQKKLGLPAHSGDPVLLLPLASVHRPAGVVWDDAGGQGIAYVDYSRFRGLDLWEAVCTVATERWVGPGHGARGRRAWVALARSCASSAEAATLSRYLRNVLQNACVLKAIQRVCPEHQSVARSLGIHIAYDAIWRAVEPAWLLYLADGISLEVAVRLMTAELRAVPVPELIALPDAPRMAADFYMLEYLARSDPACGRLLAQFCTEASAFMQETVSVTIGCELGHITQRYEMLADEADRVFLRGLLGCDSRLSWASAQRGDPGTALRRAERIFGGPFTDFDGVAWAPIARTLRRFADGELSQRVFLDWCFSVRHNSGPIFDKFCGVAEVTTVLDAQAAGDVTTLADYCSESVRALWDAASERMTAPLPPEWLWIQPPVTGRPGSARAGDRP